MKPQFARTALLLGEAGVEALQRAHVAVFGLGGVGGSVVEALARSGVGTLTIVDHDTVSVSNLNRQIIATVDTVGMRKTDAAERRAKSVNPDVTVQKSECFVMPETVGTFDFSSFDYVVDAIDTVAGKLAIIEAARAAGTPVISSMGTGNKLDPSLLRVSDITKTETCPLARVMRKELKARNVPHLDVVWSPEPPIAPDAGETERLAAEGEGTKRRIPGSTAFVPPAAGLLIASYVVRRLVGEKA